MLHGVQMLKGYQNSRALVKIGMKRFGLKFRQGKTFSNVQVACYGPDAPRDIREKMQAAISQLNEVLEVI